VAAEATRDLLDASETSTLEEPESAAVEAPRPAVSQKRRRHRRLLVGGVVAVVAVVAVVLAVALSSGGGGGPSTSGVAAQPSAPKVKPAPTRYVQLLPAGMSKRRAVAPLYATYKATIGRWQRAAEARTAAMRGVSSSDPYAAAAFVEKPGTGWLNASTQETFTNAIITASRKRLAGLAGPKRQFLTDTMVARFNDDALYLCHESNEWKQTEDALSRLDTKSSAIVDAAANKPWYPKGYNVYDGDPTIAYEWDNRISKCQDNYGVSGEYCWGMKVIAQQGCQSSIYAEISILQGQTAIDYSNDTLAGLEPGQVGELAFQAFENTSGALTGQLKKISCY
jgi:hypothetical protein